MNASRSPIDLPPQKGKINALEGLRGVAALVVVISHLKLTFYSASPVLDFGMISQVSNRLIGGLSNGFFSVWLFWVMSGFVLSLKYHMESDQRLGIERLRDATIKRYPRLLPPVLMSVVISWSLLALGLMTNKQLANRLGLTTGAWPGSFFSFEPSIVDALKGGIWQAFFIYDPSRSYNPVLWTMEKEFYGSLFLFAGLAIFGKWRSRWLAYIATLAILHKLGMNWVSSFVMGSLVCDVYVHGQDLVKRFPETLQGVVGRVINGQVLSGLTVAMLIILVGPAGDRGELIYLFAATVMTALVVISPILQSWLGTPLLVFLGKISFGIYLVHVPVLFSLGYPLYLFFVSVFREGPARLMTSITLLLVSSISGWVLWRLADRPAVAIASRLKLGDGLRR